MNTIEPIYESNSMGFEVKVFWNRLEFKTFAGSETVPINQIAGVQLGMMGYWQVIVETTGGRKIKIPTHKKKELREAIYKAQEMFHHSQGSVNNGGSVAEELSKLHDLKEKGILSEEEFEAQKKKILN